MNQILAAVAVALIPTTLLAGPLTPPGIPAPTMKPLSDIETRTPIHPADLPISINQPGQYYLTGNAKVSTMSNGISISTSSVTIDLNGYTLQGPGTTSGGVDGINAQSPRDYITIRNGTVTNWPGAGLNIATSTTLIENVTSRDNGGAGFLLLTAHVINCVAERNNAPGISFFADSTPGYSMIQNCNSSYNAGNGLSIITPSTVLNNTFSENRDHGMFVAGSRCTIRGNTCTSNGSDGIAAAASTFSLIENNLCTRNGGTGIDCGGPGRVENNECAGNLARGFSFYTGCFAAKNVARQNPVGYRIQGTPVVGPIVNVSAGGIITSEHPWANFEY